MCNSLGSEKKHHDNIYKKQLLKAQVARLKVQSTASKIELVTLHQPYDGPVHSAPHSLPNDSWNCLHPFQPLTEKVVSYYCFVYVHLFMKMR